MSKKQYEKFSLGLALFDALPVIFFSTAMILIAMHFRVAAFIAGAICCTAAGLGKVCWKIIIAATGKDIWPLNKQLRILMPAGFALMIAGLVIGMDRKLWQTLGVCVVSFPAVLLFGITVVGMVLMGIFAKKLDGTKVKSNWIEQITNAIAQGCFLLGVFSCPLREAASR